MSDDVDYDRPDRPWTSQPAPQPNGQESVHQSAADWLCGIGRQALAGDLLGRGAFGVRKYGTMLQPHNGRRADRDCYEEVLDALAYAEQRVREEQTGLGPGEKSWELLFWAEQRGDLATIAERVRRRAVQP